ncbi:MAG: ABC transporter permease [Spirochaetales bacterium]|nr:ABC transporter permease [Spirochaetales bacterium]
MRIKEDQLLMIRSIKGRPVESILLILGIALGIGATVSGFALVNQSLSEADKLLSSTYYHEIVVGTRQNSDGMDIAASLVSDDNNLILTVNDLAARKEVPDVKYAYVMNRTHLRFGNMRLPGSDNNGTNTSTQGSVNNQNNRTIVTGNFQPRDATGNTNTEAMPGPPSDDGFDPFHTNIDADELTSLEEPQVEEADAYRVTPEFFSAYGLNAVSGSVFSEQDIKSDTPSLILGSKLAKKIFEDAIAYGRKIQVMRDLYTITGVLAETGTAFDNEAFIPAVVPDLSGNDFRRFEAWGTTLRFIVQDLSRLTSVKAQIATYFDKEYGEGNVDISIPKVEAEAVSDRNLRLITVILILSISGLLIAIVNVTNILVSRMERRRKSLGILKALGASTNKILISLEYEALFIGVCGALTGTVIAVVLSEIIKNSLGTSGYNALILVLGVFISWIFTMVVTGIPAFQISKIAPSEAIRYE